MLNNMITNFFFIFIFNLGVFFILLGLFNCQAPKKIIEYRYIPRTFQEEQKEPVSVFNFYDDLFQDGNILVN